METEVRFGADDLDHLRKIERFGRTATAMGLGTAWVPNPVSMARSPRPAAPQAIQA
jgi:hypothetical protein